MNHFEGKCRRALALLVLTTALVAVPAAAQNLPQYMSHQGRVLDTNLVPLGGTHEMTFTMYQNGQTVWSESVSVEPSESRVARSIKFSSSRMLPGQG